MVSFTSRWHFCFTSIHAESLIFSSFAQHRHSFVTYFQLVADTKCWTYQAKNRPIDIDKTAKKFGASVKRRMNTVSNGFFHIVRINCFLFDRKMQFINRKTHTQWSWHRIKGPTCHTFGRVWLDRANPFARTHTPNSPQRYRFYFQPQNAGNSVINDTDYYNNFEPLSLSLSTFGSHRGHTIPFSRWRLIAIFNLTVFFSRSFRCHTHIHWTLYIALIRSLFNHYIF